MRHNRIITADLIEVPMSSPQSTVLVKRFAFFATRTVTTEKTTIRGQRLIHDEVDKVSKLYSDFDREAKFVWLTPKPNSKLPCYKIDLSKLDGDNIRAPSWTDDILYRGDISSIAIGAIFSPRPMFEYDDDHISEFMNLIKRDCSDYLSQWDKQTPLFYGVQDIHENNLLFADTSRFLYEEIKTNGTPSILETAMRQDGFIATESNSIRVSGDPVKAASRGSVYAVFPWNGYHFTHSNTESNIPMIENTIFGAMKIQDHWNTLKDNYQNNDINEAIVSGKDFMLSGRGFYAINANTLAQFAKNGLMEKREKWEIGKKYFTRQIEVLLNPSKSELFGFGRNLFNGGDDDVSLRGEYFESDKLFVFWDASSATHGDIEEYLDRDDEAEMIGGDESHSGRFYIAFGKNDEIIFVGNPQVIFKDPRSLKMFDRIDYISGRETEYKSSKWGIPAREFPYFM